MNDKSDDLVLVSQVNTKHESSVDERCDTVHLPFRFVELQLLYKVEVHTGTLKTYSITDFYRDSNKNVLATTHLKKW